MLCGLNECPRGLRRLNTQSPVGGSVWRGLGSVSLLEEGPHWQWTLRVRRLSPLPVCFLRCARGSRCELSAPVAKVCSTTTDSNALELLAQINFIL